MHNRINTVRNAHGAGDCVYDNCLVSKAQGAVNWDFSNNKFGHPPDYPGRIASCHDTWNGEIMMEHHPPGITAAAIVQVWFNSPAHQPILLSKQAHKLGVFGRNGYLTISGTRRQCVVWCAEFGA